MLQPAIIVGCGKTEDQQHPYLRKFSQPLPASCAKSGEYGTLYVKVLTDHLFFLKTIDAGRIGVAGQALGIAQVLNIHDLIISNIIIGFKELINCWNDIGKQMCI